MKIPSYLYTLKFSGIYCIENTVNHKRYIGSTKNIYGRLHSHKTKLVKGNHENSYLQNSVNKHGIDKFECYSIEFCEITFLTELEQKWVDILNPEYNITLKIIRNELSKKSKDKISKTLKEGYKSGRIKFTKTRAIKVYDLNGNFIENFDTIRECSRKLDIHTSSIIRCLRGIYQQAKGYQFKYKEDKTPVLKIEKSKYLRRFNKPAPVKLDEFRESPEEDNPEPS